MNGKSAPPPVETIRPNQAGPMNRQAGLTLVEVMISLTLGLLLLAGIGAIYLGSSQTYRAQEAGARIQETGRYALDVIGRSLRQAGSVNISTTNNTNNPLDMKVAFGGTPILGVDNACLPPVGTANTDIVTVQYDGLAGEQDCQAVNITPGENVIVQHTFFIQNDTTQNPIVSGLRCNAIRNATAFAPPATCPFSTANAAGVGAALVDNVEDMRIVYGIYTGVSGSLSDQSAASYTATPGNWGQVVSVRVCLLVRSANLGVATSQSYLNCPGALGTVTGTAAFTTATDTRLRRTFVATFNLRNRVNNSP